MPGSPRNPVIESVRRALGRHAGPPDEQRPAVLPARQAGPQDEEIERLIGEIRALSGSARRVSGGQVQQALQELVNEQTIQKAVLWPHPVLERLQLAERLASLGVEIIPADADPQTMAACDLGITGVDFALPETGSLGLLSSGQKPRPVSLLPRVHLAVMTPQALRADLHQVFAEAKDRHYLVLITGPSRTADIELTVTLGVHGPKALHCWIFEN